MSGGGGSSTTNTVAQPWHGQKKYLEKLYSRAEQAYQKGPMQFYPGSTLAERSPWTMTGLGQLAARGEESREGFDLAEAEAMKTAEGGYLGSNPFLDQMYNQAAGQVTEQFRGSVLPGLETRFGGAGRARSGAYRFARTAATEALGGELGSMAERFYGGAYETERGRQMQAVGMLPGMAGQREAFERGDIEAQLEAGRSEDVYSQSLIGELVDRWNFKQEEPWKRMGLYQEAIGGPYAGGGSTYGKTDTDQEFNILSLLGFG